MKMDNKEFGKQLENRTKKFAINVIELSALLPNTPEGKVVRNQFTKAGSIIAKQKYYLPKVANYLQSSPQ